MKSIQGKFKMPIRQLYKFRGALLDIIFVNWNDETVSMAAYSQIIISYYLNQDDRLKLLSLLLSLMNFPRAILTALSNQDIFIGGENFRI